MKEIILNVEDIECAGCENRIQNTLKNIKGIESVVANHTEGTVTFKVQDEITEEFITKKLQNLGFEVIGNQV